ncbi:MAG: O-antigen ligase family protein, partial [Planctomycetota bacterium]
MKQKVRDAENRSRLGVNAAGLIGAVSMLFFHPGAMDMDRLKGNLLLVVLLPLAAAAFGVNRFARISTRPLPGVLGCAALLCFFLVLSFIPGFCLHADGLGMVARLLALILLAMLVRNEARAHSRVIPAWLLGAGTATAGYALLQSAGFEPFYLSNPQRDPVSFLGNTNELAEVMALLIPMAMALIFDVRKSVFRAAMACLPLLIAAIWISGGRGGMLAALCGGLVFFMIMPRAMRVENAETLPSGRRPGSIGKRVWIVAGVAGLGLILASAVGSKQHLVLKKIDSDASIFSADYPTNQVRIEIWKSTLSMISDHPVFGSGPCRFRMTYPPYRSRIEAELPGLMGARTEVIDPHNEFLWAAAEGGLPAGIAFAIFCFLLIRAGIRSATEAAKTRGDLLMAGLAGSATAFAVLSLFRSPLHNPATAVILFLIAGQLSAETLPHEAGTRPFSLVKKASALIGLGMLLGVSLWIGGRGLASDWMAASTSMREEIGPDEL